MERELEKDLKEIEYLIYVHKNRGNTNTQSVLERVHEIIETCAKAARTLPELEELLSRENGPEITRSSRDNKCGEFSGGVQMVTIQKCKRHGVCNDCGKQQSEETDIWEIRSSVTGQGWNTLMLCKECMMSLHTAMAIAVTQQ